MGFLARITKNTPDSRTDGNAVELSTPASRLKKPPAKQYNERGIPPIKDPELPPDRAAALIACTSTRRAYWIVFRYSPESEYSWVWDRNIPAVPDESASNQFDTTTAGSANAGSEELLLGGRDWGDWSCPGCGQPQIPTGTGNFVHYRICRCGQSCCLGPGSDGTKDPTCPNCRRRIPEEAQMRTTIANTRHSSQLPDAARELFTSDKREIEDR